MSTSKRTQHGFGLVSIALIVVSLGAIAAVGWYVWDKNQNQKPAITNFDECAAAGYPIMESYPEQCAADGRTFVRELSEEEKSNLNPPSRLDIDNAEVKVVKFSQLPNELRVVALSKIKELAPVCESNGQILDDIGEPVDPEVQYSPVGSAIVGIGCDGGAAGLFATDKNDSWVFVASTQDFYDCDAIFNYPVPKQILGLSGGPARCYERSEEQVKSYEEASKARFY